jgi:hypothetical protein
MDAEEHANTEFTLKMDVDQWALVTGILQEKVESGELMPEEVQTLKELKTIRTR